MSVMSPEDFGPEMQAAAANWQQQQNQPNAATNPQQFVQDTNRWSYHLANDPFGGAAGQWAKKYYDNPNIDPGAAIKREVDAYRTQYGAGAGSDDATTINMIATGQTPQAQQTAMQSWSNPQTQGAVNTAVQQSAENKARADSLWSQLAGMVTQSQDVSKSPVVQAQTDAYAAAQEKARRNYISDAAERYGPLANIQGEERMAAEAAGKNTGAFHANAMAEELSTIRDQIMNALQMQSGFLSADRQASMNEAVSQIDAILKSMGLDLQRQGLDQDWRRALMNNDLGLRQLGLQDWDRQQYDDLVQRGLI